MKQGALFLLLCACTPGMPGEGRPQHEVGLDSAGIEVRPEGMRIDFGRSPAGVIRALDRILGPHHDTSLKGCPDSVAQQLQWGDLFLTFNREQFIGWRQGEQAAGIVCD